MSIDQYEIVHRSCGIIESTNRLSVVDAKGRDVIDLVHRLSTNDLRPMAGKAGLGAGTVLTDEKGKIIDVVQIFSNGAEQSFIISFTPDPSRLLAWLRKYTIMDDAKFETRNNQISFLLMGPNAQSLASKISPQAPTLPKNGWIENEQHSTICKSTLIPGGGYIVICKPSEREHVKTILSDAAEVIGGGEISDETYETLRIEAGLGASGKEYTSEKNPLEAGLQDLISFSKGCYVGQEVIARLDTYEKVKRHLTGFLFESLPELALPLSVTLDNEIIGELTSIARDATGGKGIGMGFVHSGRDVVGSKASVGTIAASIVKLPFVSSL